MTATWALALSLSFVLRYWGLQHPGPFVIRPWLVFLLLFLPVFVMGVWIFFNGFSSGDASVFRFSKSSPKDFDDK